MRQEPRIIPQDEYNTLLENNVHPPDWVNPEPAPRYNLVVIGAGTAGFVGALWIVRKRIKSVPGHWLSPSIKTKAGDSGEQ